MDRLVLAGMAALACVLRRVDSARDALNYPTGFRVNVALRTVADLGGASA
jgi:hypothetical protein